MLGFLCKVMVDDFHDASVADDSGSGANTKLETRIKATRVSFWNEQPHFRFGLFAQRQEIATDYEVQRVVKLLVWMMEIMRRSKSGCDSIRHKLRALLRQQPNTCDEVRWL